MLKKSVILSSVKKKQVGNSEKFPRYCGIKIKKNQKICLCYSSLNSKQNMTENRGPLPGDENVSVEWLNALLHEKNVIGDDVNVSTAEVQDLKGNRGLSGAISRVVLSYDKES